MTRPIHTLPDALQAVALRVLRARGVLPSAPAPRPAPLLCGCDPAEAVLVLFEVGHPEGGAWCVWCSRDASLFTRFTLEKK